MSTPVATKATISLAPNFSIAEVHPASLPVVTPTPAPASLGPLTAFVGTFSGTGFNTVFRPQRTPAALPVPVPGSDNILELNLTTETLSFSASLGSVPNRGMVQGDIFLNGVPYVQSINDVTSSPPPGSGIHFEPGIWLAVPATTAPAEGPTVARLASIPHGTTINAQGTSSVVNGAPIIPPVVITPFATPPSGIPAKPLSELQPNFFTFPSQTATAQGTARIPQDLTSFIAKGTITQAILNDPNTVLRNAIIGQKITSTTVINISTQPAALPAIPGGPTFGGGTDNIAFLQGSGAPNGQSLLMSATFWIETVQHIIEVPIFKPGEAAFELKPAALASGAPVPTFSVTPPKPVLTPRQLTVTSTQIQYSQVVMLNFNGLTWPHVSVATLVPNEPVVVPPSAWE